MANTKLVWEKALGLVAKVSDVRACVNKEKHWYYHVYQGVELTKFYWWLSLTSGRPNVNECSSIKEGKQLAEADYAKQKSEGTL